LDREEDPKAERSSTSIRNEFTLELRANPLPYQTVIMIKVRK